MNHFKDRKILTFVLMIVFMLKPSIIINPVFEFETFFVRKFVNNAILYVHIINNISVHSICFV